MKRILITINLFYLFLITNAICIGQNNNIRYRNHNDLLFEIPDDTVSSDRYTKDNLVYVANNKYLVTYKYIKKDTINCFKIVRNSNNNLMNKEWYFISHDSINNNDVISFLEFEILPDNKEGTLIYSDYNQTVIYYKYLTKNNPKKWNYSEHTGLVENDKNIWLHPPRIAMFKILELNPFPYIKYPLEIGKEWTWRLSVGSGWLDNRWYVWKGEKKVFEFNYEYKIVDKINISTQYYSAIECWIVESVAKSELGKTYLKSYFNEEIGFVKWEYTNIDNSQIIFEIKKVNDTDN